MPSSIVLSSLPRRSEHSVMERQELDPEHEFVEPRVMIPYNAIACHAHNAEASSSKISSPCGFTVLNYLRLAGNLVAEEIADKEILRRMVSQVMIDYTMEIREELNADTNLGIEDALKIPIFQETLQSSTPTIWSTAEEPDIKSAISAMFTGASRRIESVILCKNGEALVCLRIPVEESNAYVLFDCHSRPNHPHGPACVVSESLRDITTIASNIFSDGKANVPLDSLASCCSYCINSKDGANWLDVKELLSKSVAYISRLPTPTLTSPSHLSSPAQANERKSVSKSSADTVYSQIKEQRQLDVAPTPSASSSITNSGLSRSQSVTRQSEFGWQLALLQKQDPMSSSEILSNPWQSSPYTPSTNVNNKENVPSLPAKISLTFYREGVNVETNDNPQGNSNAGTEPFIVDAEEQMRSEPLSMMEAKKRSRELHIDADVISASPSSTFPAHDLDAALASQLQQEEEISMMVSRPCGYRDIAWLIALQKHSSTGVGADMDYQLALQLQQESSSSASTIGNNTPTNSSTFTTLQLPPVEENFECGVCAELYNVNVRITLSDCSHMFCKECLTTYAKTKIDDGRYPIFCPECVVERPRAIKNQLSEDVIQQLDIPAESLTRLQELQLVLHCITLQCPRCKEVMNVDRVQFTEQSVLVCPLPRCGHKWCKSCLKTLPSSQHQHKCKNSNIDRLMKRKGWKYCPGCRTPVQKETGCNHMTCGTPGCNVHFCYKCGVLMVDTTFGGDVGTAVTEHYMDCQLFEKRWKCSIQ